MRGSGEDASEVTADHWSFCGFIAAGAFDGGLLFVGDFLGALLGAIRDDSLKILNLIEQDIDLLVLLHQLLLLLRVDLLQTTHSAFQRLHIFLLNFELLLDLLILALDGLGVIDVMRIWAFEDRSVAGGAVAVIIHDLNTCIKRGYSLGFNESGRLGWG